MADLDVSELMDDPDFADPAILHSRTATVDPATGRTIVTETTAPITVIACTVSPVTAQRLSQGTHTTGWRAFHSVTRMTAGDAALGTEADRLEWSGQMWQVVEVNDWSTFGDGFVEAIATVTRLR